MRSPLLRALLPGAAACAVLLAPAAASALTISGAHVGPTHVDASSRRIIYYLDLHAGPEAERFSVAVQPPAFATKGGRDEGQSIDGPQQITIDGDPGTIGTVGQASALRAACSTRLGADHGYATGATTVDVALPAGANSTLALRYSIGRRAPWADTDLRLRFQIQQKLYGTYPGISPLFGAATSVAAAQSIRRTDAVAVRASGKGKIGAHLLLSASPNGTWGLGRAPRAVSRQTAIKISGQLVPGLTGKRVRLQWRTKDGPLRTAAELRTAKNGRFSATVRPPGKGTYELWGGYPSQPGPLNADSTSCPLVYRVG